jgi:plastocyanin
MRSRITHVLLRGSAVALALALGACSSNSGGSITNPSTNQPPPAQNPNTDITIVQGAQNKTTTAFTPNPKSVSLASGGTVRWVNGDITGGDYTQGTATVHNISLNDGSYQTGNLGGNGTASHTFTQAGTYGFHCTIHPNMVGTIEVTP